MKNIRIILVCFVLALLTAVTASAQWARTYGSADWDSVSWTQPTSDGGYVMVGNTGVFDFDLWVMKLDASGSIQWQKRYGDSGNQPSTKIAQTSDGGYILTGTTDSFGAGGTDAWILKLDSAGSVQWQKTYGGTGSDSMSAIAQTTDGGFIAGGTTDSFGAGSGDFWMLKLASNGNVQWQRSFGGATYDGVNDVTLTSDGGYLFAGITTSFTPPAGNNALLLKVDSTGIFQWSRTIGTAGTDTALSIQQTSDGGYILAGLTDGSGAGDNDMWVVKLSSGISIQWQKTFGGTGWDIAYCVRQTADGGYIVSGSTMSFGAGSVDGWVLKLAGSSNIMWQKTLGGTADEYMGGVIEAGGGYIAVGSTESFGAGSVDALIVKLSDTGDVSPSCSVVTDTLVSSASSTAIIGTPTASTTPGTLGSIHDSTVTPVVTSASLEDQCAPACTYCDDFEDGALASDWLYLKPAWSETGGNLVATPVRKAIAIASPAFAGCGTNCTFEAGMMSSGGVGNSVWMLAWYADKKNTLEVQMKQESGKFVLKQRIRGSIVAKTKARMPLASNVSYDVKVTYNGSSFTLFVNGNLLATLPAAGASNGTVGFQAKNTVARFGSVTVK